MLKTVVSNFPKEMKFEEVMSYVADDRFLEATEGVAMTSGLECDFSSCIDSCNNRKRCHSR